MRRRAGGLARAWYRRIVGTAPTHTREHPSSTSATGDSWLRSLARALGATDTRSRMWIGPGTVVDRRYRIERALGTGGMAVVYLARDLELDRDVALKLYDVDARELSLSRTIREARAMAALAHPNVLVVHGVGVHHDRVFLAMEYVVGGTLRAWLRTQTPTRAQILDVFGACGRGLAAAHAVGIVHGDFKPDNVLMGRDGRPRVADFGLARMMADAAIEAAGVTTTQGGASQLGFFGTPGYAAPEQLGGAVIDARADQFAFCVALHEALHGDHPFVGDDSAQRAAAIRSGRRRTRVGNTAVPRWLDRVVGRGLAHDPARRYGSVDELLAAIARGPRTRRMGALALGAAACTIVAASWPRASACDRSDDAIQRSWNAERAGALAQSFAATGSPLQQATYDDVTRRIDAWAETWRDERRAACTAIAADDGRAAIDERVRCLDRQLAQLDVALAGLAQADRSTIVRALDVVAALPPPTRCSDPNAGRELAAPGDPELAARVDAELERLAHASAAIELGRFAEAERIAGEVRSAAAASEHPPLAVAADLVLGAAHRYEAEYDAAATSLAEAYWLASTTGDDVHAEIAARTLACVVPNVRDSTQSATAWLRTAESTAQRVGVDEREEIELALCRGVTLLAEDDFAEADATYLAALDRLAHVDDPEGLLAARIHEARGRVLFDLHRDAEALEEDRRAEDIFRAARGAAHPSTFRVRAYRGDALVVLGRPGEALALQLATLQSAIAAYGEDAKALAEHYNGIAVTLSNLGAMPAAIAYAEHGVAIARTHGDDGYFLTPLLTVLSAFYLESGRYEQALAAAGDAVAVSESAMGRSHSATGEAMVNHGSILMTLARFDEAADVLARARDILQRELGDDDVSVGVLCLNLAEVFHELGRHADAERELACGDRIARASGDQRLQVAVTMWRGAWLRDAGDLERAVPLLEDAAVRARDLDPSLELQVTQDLGTIELARGHAAHALNWFERALELATLADFKSAIVKTQLAMADAEWALARKSDARRRVEDARTTAREIPEPERVAAAERWLASHR